MRFLLLSFLLLNGLLSFGQVVTTTPAFPNEDASVTITFDATQGTGGLAGYTGDVYIHTGVLTNLSTSSTDWRYVKAPWTTNLEAAKMTRIGQDLYELTLTPSIRDYYGVPESETITDLAMVFRGSTGSPEGKGNGGSDIFVELATGEFQFLLNSPSKSSFLVDQNDVITISASVSNNSTFTVTVDGQEVVEASVSDALELNYQYTVAQSFGTYDVVVSAFDGATTLSQSFTYSLRSETVTESRPVGIKRGINYDVNDNTRLTVCLQAPNKSSVYVIGDFNDWGFSSDYLMKKDGEYFWLEVNGLTPGTEYAFQYVVDESIYIGDPFCDKILNPLDQYISESIYPGLKDYPAEAVNAVGYYNTVSVLETGQEEFPWTDAEFQKPAKERLVVYELLVRDFFNNGQETYKNLTDTLSYIKSLGVNAIELMPITEYSGNDSWGYNPTFMFAVDKAHGSKNDLKQFIDKAHEMGIAVILDVVLNQQEQPSPLILLDFDLGTGKVTEDNLYFNVNATHDFSVFYDMDHLSPYTQSFVDTVNHYWINEYHFDGYRFDLSKGFMQTGSFFDYNQERIDILKRMADALWAHSPDAYLILEHLAPFDSQEEKTLANYGMMLWGNIHGPYKENILGTSSPDIRMTHHGARGWDNMHLVGYMESHDESRQTLEALFNGGSFGTYNVRNLSNALERIKLASAFLYSIPGPKMLWQFGELGYDLSINRCQDGTISNDCRTSQKPNPWDNSENYPYYLSDSRTKLRKTVSELIKLKLAHGVFTSGNYSIIESTIDPKKQITLANPSNIVFPSSADEMSVVIVGNFGLTAQQTSITFPFSGSTWYHYFDQNAPLTFSGSTTTITLQPGEFRLYTNYPLETPEEELYENLTPLAPSDLTLEEVSNGVKLTWANHSSINDGNYIYRKTNGGDWVNIGQTARLATSYTDATVSNGNTYDYRIGAYTAVGETFTGTEQILVENIALGVSEILQSSIYPNPTSGILTVNLEGKKLIDYLITDFSGKVVWKGNFTGSDYSVDFSKLGTGLYLLEVSMENGETHLAKVIKN